VINATARKTHRVGYVPSVPLTFPLNFSIVATIRTTLFTPDSIMIPEAARIMQCSDNTHRYRAAG
jgi:hypothetical protein